MSLTKEECIEALEFLCNSSMEYIEDYDLEDNSCGYYQDTDEFILKPNKEILERLIEEHFDNPPLKKEEIKKGMLVWDNFLKHWCIINLIDEDDIMVTQMSNYYVPYEEGKYFRKKVE